MKDKSVLDRILVLGNSLCAFHIAQALCACGKKVSLVTSAKDPLDAHTKSMNNQAFECLAGTSVSACRGHVGDFRITLTRNGDRFVKHFGTVIISEPVHRRSNAAAYGLPPSASVLSVSKVSAAIEARDTRLTEKTVAFLTGLHHDTGPVLLADILDAALRIQTECRSQTYILTRNLKVAANGLERRVREVKTAGTVIQKFTSTLPRIDEGSGGSIRLSFEDPVTRQPFILIPDLTVVDDIVEPSPHLKALSRTFELDTDSSGFLQTDNVHRTSVLTNRKGIIAVGPARSIQTEAQQDADINAAVITALSLDEPSVVDDIKTAEINAARCIRCLTCFRICPYRSVSKTPEVHIVSEACEGCGICTAECPRQAIALDRVDLREITDRMNAHRQLPGTHAGAPLLVIFCCKRSAMIAGETAKLLGYGLPENMLLLPVPCAGSVSTAHILTAFQRGADGVMILTCHDGNCHAERGNRFAAERAGELTDILHKIGIAPARLYMDSLAANMAAEFGQKVNRFEKRIKEIK